MFIAVQVKKKTNNQMTNEKARMRIQRCVSLIRFLGVEKIVLLKSCHDPSQVQQPYQRTCKRAFIK